MGDARVGDFVPGPAYEALMVENERLQLRLDQVQAISDTRLLGMQKAFAENERLQNAIVATERAHASTVDDLVAAHSDNERLRARIAIFRSVAFVDPKKLTDDEKRYLRAEIEKHLDAALQETTKETTSE